MGIFGDKLLLKLIATPASSGKLIYNIEKANPKMPHILPFSCLSLTGSQLTVLSRSHSRSLSQRLLGFSESPTIQYETTSLVAGFQLEIYEGNGQILYNQFSPQYTRDPRSMNDNLLETEIERTLLNHIVTLYGNAGSNDRMNLQIFLLMLVAFYQEKVIPMARQIHPFDMEGRKRLARTVIDFCTALYKSWDNPKSTSPGNALFIQKMSDAKVFDRY